MRRYDPALPPDPAAWQALEEDKRIELIEDYHRSARIKLPNLKLHSVIHAIVENQVALGDELPARRAVERLMREGLDRHDALHAVGEEALSHMTELMRLPAGSQPGGPEQAAALARYEASLERLSAQAWRSSHAEDDGGEDQEDDVPPETIEEVVAALQAFPGPLPVAAMQWSLENWDQAAPRFLRMLEDYASGAERSDDVINALFLAVHLLADKGETRAFAVLIRILMDHEATEELLGDAVMGTLSGILISTFDGDRLALRRVIESADAEPFTRQAALEAMAYLTAAGSVPEEETRAYLKHLRHSLEPRYEDPVWEGWAGAVANLGYADLEGDFEALLELGCIDRITTDTDWLRERLALVRGGADRLAGFANDRIGPFEDAVGTLAEWSSFSGDDDGYDDEGLGDGWGGDELEDGYLDEEVVGDGIPAWRAVEEPRVNPTRHIGRNDPCPCGSGKKYKKCCLG